MNKPLLDSDEQKVSYGFGLQFGQQLMRNQFEGLDVDLVSAGIHAVLSGETPAISEQSLNAAFASLQEKLQEKKAREALQLAELGKRFLDENAKRDSVKTTASGLQYEILETGNGNTPGTQNTVKTHYHGTFVDGTVFDSSVERGEPATFGVTQVISGWTEALQLMQEGDKWRIFLPAELAYGDMGSPPVIPGGASLVFEIHLIEIVE